MCGSTRSSRTISSRNARWGAGVAELDRLFAEEGHAQAAEPEREGGQREEVADDDQRGDAFQDEREDPVHEVGHRQAKGHRPEPAGHGLDGKHEARQEHGDDEDEDVHEVRLELAVRDRGDEGPEREQREDERDRQRAHREDRKSTRLNSSHTVISYAVFCLKKKKKKTTRTHYSTTELITRN